MGNLEYDPIMGAKYEELEFDQYLKYKQEEQKHGVKNYKGSITKRSFIPKIIPSKIKSFKQKVR